MCSFKRLYVNLSKYSEHRLKGTRIICIHRKININTFYQSRKYAVFDFFKDGGGSRRFEVVIKFFPRSSAKCCTMYITCVREMKGVQIWLQHRNCTIKSCKVCLSCRCRYTIVKTCFRVLHS